MTDTIDLLLDAVQEVYGEKTPNEALRPPFIEHVEQARADEREKVLSEVEGWLVDEEIEKVNVPHVSAKRGHYVKTKDPSSYTRNKFRAELRAKLNQLKGTDATKR